MKHAEFVDLMRTVGAETEQFLNVFDFGSRDEASQVFQALMRAGIDHVRSHLDVRAVRVWVNDGSDALRCACGSPSTATTSMPLVLESIVNAEVRHENDTLCIPLQDRDYDTNAVIEMEGVASRALAERTLRDFVRPFGLLAQISVKFEDFA
jgi:hypothetical protein